MKEINPYKKSVLDLLKSSRFNIDYYQRGYKWQKKNMDELLQDLQNEFREHHKPHHERGNVAKYENYFLGSIVISNEDGVRSIIDGQQRLTSITLLLIYMYKQGIKTIEDLIRSETFGKKTYNINIEERKAFMDCLLEKDIEKVTKMFGTSKDESINNLLERYKNIEESLQPEIKSAKAPDGEVLCLFSDWLIHKVIFIEIEVKNEQDAHTIFTSMNDRGLSLAPIDMLKGFLLSGINDPSTRTTKEKEWKKCVENLRGLGKDKDAECIKYWFRSHFANTMRDKKGSSTAQDFENIGDSYHKWVYENRETLKLVQSNSFIKFIDDFKVFAEVFCQIDGHTNQFDKKFEHLFYNNHKNYTLQYLLIFSSITPEDSEEERNTKIRLLSCFADTFTTIRILNNRKIDYDSLKDHAFKLAKEIRNKTIKEQLAILKREIEQMKGEPIDIDGIKEFSYNSVSNKFMLHILARISNYVEVQSDSPVTSFADYVDRSKGNKNYDVEHIIADQYTKHEHDKDYPSLSDFQTYRNLIGGLLLLPRDKNRSFGDMKYADKLKKYFGENLLAKSLHKDCYVNHPNFVKFVSSSGLKFTKHDEFKQKDLLARVELYRDIANKIWNKDNLEIIVNE